MNISPDNRHNIVQVSRQGPQPHLSSRSDLTKKQASSTFLIGNCMVPVSEMALLESLFAIAGA
jgi:hypothetical protein